MESKSFGTPALASLTAGTLLCDSFSEVHEAAEYLMGHPIWTHEFASRPLWDLMKTKLLEQHPGLPADHPGGVDETNWEAYRDVLIEELGAELTITKGSEERAADPISTARAMLGPDKPIIGVLTE